jgi:hypothetical protein
MSEDHEKHRNLCDKIFERNNFYFGKLMKAQDFITEQSYFNEKRWLINRMIHGWGVVCGLDVEQTSNPNEVKIKPGLAIDCCGREILVCKSQTISLLPEAAECNSEMNTHQTNKHELYAICLKYKECKTEHFPVMYSACDQKEKCQYNRIRDWFEIEIVPFSKPDWEKHFCPKRYGCWTDDEESHDHCMSLHQCICDHLCSHDFCKHNFPECHDRSCIILATYTLDNNSGIGNINQYTDRKMDEEFDKYSHRRLVYNNPLLYDLISCYHGDLPRVCDISWEHDKKSYEWDYFRDAVVPNGLKVTFNKPMNPAMLNQHTFRVVAITIEDKTGYRLHQYVPGKIKPFLEESSDSDVKVFTFEFDPRWVNDEVGTNDVPTSAGYSAIAHGAKFEITLRGCSIFSKDGKALDGCFMGDLPSGTGTQGADFFSWFSVHKRDGHIRESREEA